MVHIVKIAAEFTWVRECVRIPTAQLLAPFICSLPGV
jgi:hypothetical protein